MPEIMENQAKAIGPWSVWIGQGDMMRKQTDGCDEVIFLSHATGDNPDKWFIGMSTVKPERLVGLAIMIYDKAAEAKLLPPRTWGQDKQVTKLEEKSEGLNRTISIPLTPEALKALGGAPPAVSQVPE